MKKVSNTDYIQIGERAKTMAYYNYACAGCGLSSADHLECDHVQPVKYYQNLRGRVIDSTFRNLQALCSACNKIKGDVYHMPRLAPRQPIYDTREADKNRAKFREMVKSHEESLKLF